MICSKTTAPRMQQGVLVVTLLWVQVLVKTLALQAQALGLLSSGGAVLEVGEDVR